MSIATKGTGLYLIFLMWRTFLLKRAATTMFLKGEMIYYSSLSLPSSGLLCGHSFWPRARAWYLPERPTTRVWWCAVWPFSYPPWAEQREIGKMPEDKVKSGPQGARTVHTHYTEGEEGRGKERDRKGLSLFSKPRAYEKVGVKNSWGLDRTLCPLFYAVWNLYRWANNSCIKHVSLLSLPLLCPASLPNKLA